jgi:hypothetical protein
MMDAAERDHEFVARLAAERPWLQEPQVMRVGWLATGNQAPLLGDMAKVVPVAIPARRCSLCVRRQRPSRRAYLVSGTDGIQWIDKYSDASGRGLIGNQACGDPR